MNKPFRNYHMMMTPVRYEGDVRIWRCDYCGQEGPINVLQTCQCSHEYEPCDRCGGSPDTNECQPDCPGIMEILNDPSVHVTGGT